MTLPFKAVAFDMDGTFLRDDKHFDQQRFANLLDQLTTQGIRVIVASGDQYENLAKYFTPAMINQLIFVCENGAYVRQGEQPLLVKALDSQMVAELVPFMIKELGITPLMAGVKAGYLSRNLSPEMMKWMKFYFPKHVVVDNFDQLPDDQFFQISFTIDDEEEVKRLLAQIESRFPGKVKATPSGNGSVDLTIPGVDKAFALRYLLDKWGLSNSDLMAFGDGGNDVTMLQLADTSWAMPNGGAAAQSVANHQVPVDNNHDGVLVVLDDYLRKN